MVPSNNPLLGNPSRPPGLRRSPTSAPAGARPLLAAVCAGASRPTRRAFGGEPESGKMPCLSMRRRGADDLRAALRALPSRDVRPRRGVQCMPAGRACRNSFHYVGRSPQTHSWIGMAPTLPTNPPALSCIRARSAYVAYIARSARGVSQPCRALQHSRRDSCLPTAMRPGWTGCGGRAVRLWQIRTAARAGVAR